MHFGQIVVCVWKGKEKAVISDCRSIAGIYNSDKVWIASTNNQPQVVVKVSKFYI
jgi:hypothetical protein